MSLVGFSPFASRAKSAWRTREKAAMPAPPCTPLSAKTLLLDGDLLVCVLGGVYTDVEKTMIELQRMTVVQDTRSAFQNAMQHKFIAAVERLSGRVVLSFISNQHVGPDLEVELFMLEPVPSEIAIAMN
jgi:uncharacterized protein YbcI